MLTDRNNIEDINIVSETMKISQVSGEMNPQTSGTDEKWLLTSSYLPCSCSLCHIHPSYGACIYKEEKNISTHVVKKKIAAKK